MANTGRVAEKCVMLHRFVRQHSNTSGCKSTDEWQCCTPELNLHQHVWLVVCVAPTMYIAVVWSLQGADPKVVDSYMHHHDMNHPGRGSVRPGLFWCHAHRDS